MGLIFVNQQAPYSSELYVGGKLSLLANSFLKKSVGGCGANKVTESYQVLKNKLKNVEINRHEVAA